jgi:hypothetical protein
MIFHITTYQCDLDSQNNLLSELIMLPEIGQTQSYFVELEYN